MIKARKLGHIVLSVSDLDVSRDFYLKVLGAEVVAGNASGKIVFLSLGEQHHDIALIQRSAAAKRDPAALGMVHMAWQLDDFEALQSAYRELNEAGIASEPVQHNITNSLYIDDPDGHLLELYCDRWGEKGKEVMRTEGPGRVPLDMATGEGIGEPQQLLPENAGPSNLMAAK